MIGHPERSPDLDVYPGFRSPPPGYGVVPFYWWVGETLTRERLSWQLDELEGSSITGLQINYAHDDQGGQLWGLTFQSDPPLFSEAWWDLFKWFLKEAKKRNMCVSLSDYTLCSPGQGWYTDYIINEHPGIRGLTLEHSVHEISEGIRIACLWGPDTLAVVADRIDDGTGSVMLWPESSCTAQNGIWICPEGRWRLTEVFQREHPRSIDPMNPFSGELVIKYFFQPFEERNPGESGQGLNFFFSDELNFGISGHLWNDAFPEEFLKRKGYELVPELPSLFVDRGPRSVRVRLDYRDVMVRLEEENYFKPVYEWHENRGMIYGCDHGGRGKEILEFGDYFRTQKWNQAPGNDNPYLESDISKNKVASSIAHMYERPRTWLEGFHSSGWGTSSADLTDALFRNFVMGHNLVSLHGLYYTTMGGYWEWAPPCNHFRMPYWKHMRYLLSCVERLSYLLSQGIHCADIAILYPSAACEAGLNAQDAAAAAFSLGETLFSRGIDFDYIDFESLDRALVSQDNPTSLCVSGERFRVLLFPAMKAVRYSSLEKALEFRHAGGLVIAFGCLPTASDRMGSNDPQLDSLVAELFGRDAVHSHEEVVGLIDSAGIRDFFLYWLDSGNPGYPVYPTERPKPLVADGNTTWVLHRSIGFREIYAVYGVPLDSTCFFRARGKVELWDPWTGTTTTLTELQEVPDGMLVRMPLERYELQVIVFDRRAPRVQVSEKSGIGTLLIKASPMVTTVEGEWEFNLIPTRDNTWGDFRLPASNEIIGAEVSRLRLTKMNGGYSKKEYVTTAFGPRFEILGPLPVECEITKLPETDWKPYEYSDRWGIRDDPGHQGYHGLKGKIHDEFLAFGQRSETQTGTEYLPELAGSRYVFRTNVLSRSDGTALVRCGAIRPEKILLNGKELPGVVDSVHLMPGQNTLMITYLGPGKTWFILETPGAASDWTQSVPLAMSWFRKPGILMFDPYPKSAGEEYKFEFNSPPALNEISFQVHGLAHVKVNGCPVTVVIIKQDDGTALCRAIIAVPEARSVPVIIHVRPETGYHGGAVFPEPVRLVCGTGLITLGDWSSIDGLYSYSGGARYQKVISLNKPAPGERLVLDLGDLVSSAELHVNGILVGVRVAPPWRFDVTDHIISGSNRFEVQVFNTLSNHYTTIPTRYRGSIKSGLIGPVTLSKVGLPGPSLR